MTERSTAEVLKILADEVSDMACLAQEFDQGLGRLKLQSVLPNCIHQLQHVDALHQHLRDVSVALNSIVALIEPGPTLDLRRITTQLTLDDLRARLNGQRSSSETALDDGTVQFF